MEYPTNFDDQIQTFPAEQLGTAGREAWQQLQDKGYEVTVGLTPDLADEIAKLSLETSIREYCPRDSSERFTDRGAAQKWLSKGRGVFLLINKQTRSVAGYGWVGPGTDERIQEGETTFAIRIAEAGQGQGLATPYSRLIIAGAAILYGAKNIWLETWQSNGGAVHIYHKLGAVDVAQDSSQRPTADGGKVADTRLYMTLADDLLNI